MRTLFRMTSFNINLELFEKYQATKECIRCKENTLKTLKINTGKHELVDTADVYKDGHWQGIRCTCWQGVFSLREPTHKDIQYLAKKLLV